MEISSRYEFKEYEEALYKRWEGGGYFIAPLEAPDYYCIVIPPPNITGELHMGHALNNTIQDILIRYHRMLGFGTLWIPGTDHASIATENVLEKQLAKENLTKRGIGREEFLKRVWRWKEIYGGIIVKQLRRLGVSCDWSRERFTMDEHLSRAVKEAFVRLFKEGLIYRGEYLVNWCPRCRTALSDDEVEHTDEQGKLWYLRYPYAEGEGYIEVATTRPETMLGDTAVAVNPDDERYKNIVGKMVVLPLIKRRIPIIADEAVQKDFGTGAVKITPAHDFNDFEIAKRRALPFVNILNPDGTLNENAGAFKGLDRYEARKRIVDDLSAQELLGRIEEHSLALGRCYRCNTPIEPYLSKQWFVKMKPLAEPAIKAVEEGKMRFFPERWRNYYLSWLNNVRDWCISRQLWWGHRIPVFYCDDCGEVFADVEEPKNCPKCSSTKIHQDEDVLDTWFSSALWPFSTMGWPLYKTKDGKALIERFFPTNVLVTDRGIIFFWVARMAMTSLRFMKDVPFEDVYIHGTILDELGRKMSKSLGNGIDPVEMIDIYGADAVRFSLIMLTVEGQDVRLSQSKFEMGRNFTNKLWNAMRLVLSNLQPLRSTEFFNKYEAEKQAETSKISGKPDPLMVLLSQITNRKQEMVLEDRWIVSRLARLLVSFKALMKDYRLNEVLRSVYEFFWHEFCDWYLELVKPRLKKGGIGAETAQITMFVVSDAVLRSLHPFMPFVTEHLWNKLYEASELNKPKLGLEHFRKLEPSLMIAPFPQANDSLIDEDAEELVSGLMELVRGVRQIKSRFGLNLKAPVPLIITSEDETLLEKLKKEEDFIRLMAFVKDLSYGNDTKRPQGAASETIRGGRIFVPLGGLVDFEKEKAKLNKDIEENEARIKRLKALLSKEDFLKNAPQDVVEKQRTTLEELAKKISAQKTALEELTT